MKSISRLYLLQACLLSASVLMRAQDVIIQENDTGFCTLDGTIMTSVEGYTGIGYADTDRGIGKSVSWSILSPTADTCRIKWRYSNGGGTGDRLADLLINLEIAAEDVNFTHTGEWTNWQLTDSVAVELRAGYNGIRLVSQSEDGLANIDYIEITAPGLETVECIPVYTVAIGQNIAEAGTISIEPELPFYDDGTVITLTAHANEGYFFHDWSGNISGTDTAFTFTIHESIQTRAMFYPVGTTMDTNIIGYATVQDDEGTPFLVTGGKLGSTVEANSLTDLLTYLQSDIPYTVTVSGKIEGTGEVKIRSDKTLQGITDSAYIKGIMIQIDGAQNVIVQHMKFSHVVQWDEIEITGGSRNVWIDHCEFFTDRDHDIDYYDGLLDIKNASKFITISWCRLHDHKKCSLISSGDGSTGDTVIRVTYHHNFFYNCDARLPSIRFGKAHIFNNYYLNSEDAISTRMGACVRVENNYFENIEKAVFNDQSPEPGYVHLLGNRYGSAFYVTEPTCILDVPYPYEAFLDAVDDVPGIVGDTSEPVIAHSFRISQATDLLIYPNPADGEFMIRMAAGNESNFRVRILDHAGQVMLTLEPELADAGLFNKTVFTQNFAPGLYLVELTTGSSICFGKLVVMH